jgi:hypothetical protein
MLFSVYYQTRENGDYLREVVNASGVGQLKNVEALTGLPAEPEADVVLLEYEGNNPQLDHWIARTSAGAKRPEIFLYVKEISPRILWQALRLGARECFAWVIEGKDLREAVRRVGAA